MKTNTNMLKQMLLLSAFVASPSFAGDLLQEQVPVAVVQYVKNAYPQSKNIEWDYDKDDRYYEADFEISGQEIEVKIASDGSLIIAKEDVDARNIPEAVKEGALKAYPNAKILGANRITRPDSVTWDVGVKLDNGQYKNIYLLPNGHLK